MLLAVVLNVGTEFLHIKRTCMSDIEYNCNRVVHIFVCLFVCLFVYRSSHLEVNRKPNSEYDEVNFKPHTEELRATVNPAYQTTVGLKEAGNDEHIYDNAY